MGFLRDEGLFLFTTGWKWDNTVVCRFGRGQWDLGLFKMAQSVVSQDFRVVASPGHGFFGAGAKVFMEKTDGHFKMDVDGSL